MYYTTSVNLQGGTRLFLLQMKFKLYSDVRWMPVLNLFLIHVVLSN